MGEVSKTALVTGATGRQGGAVVRRLLSGGWTVRAPTCNPSSHSAQRSARQGIEVAPGDFDDLASLERAATLVYGVYSVQDA